MAAEILGLRTTIYKVSDISKAKEWYTAVLGYQPYFDEPYYVGFNVEGFELGLQPEESSNEKSESVVTYWGVQDVPSTYQRLVTLGATEFEKPTEVGGGIVVATVKDPWGNAFGIIFNPHFTLG